MNKVTFSHSLAVYYVLISSGLYRLEIATDKDNDLDYVVIDKDDLLVVDEEVIQEVLSVFIKYKVKNEP